MKKWKQIASENRSAQEQIQLEKNELKEELSQFKVILNKLSSEYSRISQSNNSENHETERLKQQLAE